MNRPLNNIILPPIIPQRLEQFWFYPMSYIGFVETVGPFRKKIEKWQDIISKLTEIPADLKTTDNPGVPFQIYCLTFETGRPNLLDIVRHLEIDRCLFYTIDHYEGDRRVDAHLLVDHYKIEILSKIS